MQTDSNSAAIKPKPKFAPKIPTVKKESTETAVINEGGSSVPADGGAANKPSKSQKSSQHNDRGGKGGGGRGGRGPGGSGGRGGHWTMPLGPLFFSAGATQNVSTNNSSSVKPIVSTSSLAGASVAAGSGGGNRKVSARPNEIIDDVVVANGNRVLAPVPKVKAEGSDAMSISSDGRNPSPFPIKAEEQLSDDSDASDSDADLITSTKTNKGKMENDDSDEERQLLEGKSSSDHQNNDNMLGEVWPPQHRYTSLAPVTLPLGPKTGTVRRYLQQQPILAHPEDAQSVQNEQENALFLVQLPSDLNLRHLLDSQGSDHTHRNPSASTAMDVDEGNTAHGNQPALAASTTKRAVFRLGDKGHLGKIQLLKSGRVRMLIPTAVQHDGSDADGQQQEVMEFEVGAGLMTSFYQDLLAISTPTTSSSVLTTATAGTPGVMDVTGPETVLSSSGHNNINNINNNSSSSSSSNPNQGSDCSMHMMGQITRKLVVTPPFDVLGEKKAKIKATVSFQDAVLAAQSEAAEAQMLKDGAQTLGFSQYLERLNAGAGDLTQTAASKSR